MGDHEDQAGPCATMRVFILGSAPLSEPISFNRFEALTGFRILERYGMSQTAMNTSNLIDPAGRKAESVNFTPSGYFHPRCGAKRSATASGDCR
ncbi:MAG: hypothetical protein U5R30_14965 [Deltaproteobacteria bacterium]|nr:hypothetical protein [Deltaproteobacteria bacterium]